MTLVESTTPGAVEITVWDLAMTEPPTSPPPAPPPDTVVLEATEPAPELSRLFYQLVGRDFHWVDRIDWTDQQWWDWVDRPQHHLHSLWVGGAPAGYVELETQDHATVEIVYFGLVPRFHGRGLGRYFLETAIHRAWAIPGTERVWLHTCSLDGPAALPNYQARGFTIVGQRSEWRLVDPA